MKEWIPLFVACIAIFVALLNSLFSLKLAKQKNISDKDLKRLESDLSVIIQQKLDAASRISQNDLSQLEELEVAIKNSQKLKDHIRMIQYAIENPRSQDRDSVIAEFTAARIEYENAHMRLASWLSVEQRKSVHESKNKSIAIVGMMQKELTGGKFVDGASFRLSEELKSLLDILSDAQALLRDLADARRVRLFVEASR